jgi:hypothetical protein
VVAELSDPGQPTVSVRGALSEAWRVYRLLFARLVVTAGSVYGALTAIGVLHHLLSSWPAQLLALVLFIGWIAGPAIVCGAIVELIGNVHDGRPPRPVSAVLRLGRDRVFPLIGALLFYGFGTALGLLLLIVPGLMIAARWSLLLPVVILEELELGEARDRSTKLAQEHTGSILAIVAVTFVLCSWSYLVPEFVLDGYWARTLVRLVGYTLTAPFFVAVVTTVYYRLVSPERPDPP